MPDAFMHKVGGSFQQTAACRMKEEQDTQNRKIVSLPEL